MARSDFASQREAGFAWPQSGSEVQVHETQTKHSARPEAQVGEIETRLAARIGAQRYRMWFAEHAELSCEPDGIVVRVGNRFAAEWIGRHFLQDLEAVVESVTGRTQVRVVADETAEVPPASPPAPEIGEGPLPSHTPVRSAPARSREPRWRRFDEFIVGPCNRVAFEAARRLADDTLGGIRCVLLHGGCGVGKTHLLQALCAARSERSPGERVRYTTGEQFTNEYIQAVRSGSVDAFRERVRKLDLLAIDDVHFLSNKGATQAEFLHTMDAIGLAGARIAIVTDAHPRALASFSEALVSRLLGGMVVHIEAPDRDTRQMLVERMAAARGLHLEGPAALAVADRVLGSVREIEGALARIAALLLLEDAPQASLTLVERALGAGGPSPRGGPLRIGGIVDATCEALGVDRNELTASSRHRRVVLARGVVVHLAREMTTMSYPEIARHLGRTAHSSAHAAAERVAGMLDRGEVLRPGDCQCGARSVRELVETVRRAAERAGKAAR
jgi:chromosomal replication initiator protein